MNATVYLAILSHPRRGGEAIGPEEIRPVPGAPLHLSLHTTATAAVAALRAAMAAEWEDTYAYGLGPATAWEPARLSRRMVGDGYLAAVIERPVSLDGGEDDWQPPNPAAACDGPCCTGSL